MWRIAIEHACGCRHGDVFVERLCEAHATEIKTRTEAAELQREQSLRRIHEVIKSLR
jgi:hypothetical protein